MDNIIVWFGLAIIPAIWFLQNVVHESSHGILPLIKGCKIKIYPWPKFMNGRWYMAYMTYEYPAGVGGFSPAANFIVSASPRIVDLLIIAITTVIQPENAWVNTVLQAWQIAAFIDFSFNTMGAFYGPDRGNDAWACAKLAGWDSKVGWFRAISVAATAAALVPVLFRFFS